MRGEKQRNPKIKNKKHFPLNFSFKKCNAIITFLSSNMPTKSHFDDFSALFREAWRIFSQNFFQVILIMLVAFLLFTTLLALLTALFVALFGFNFMVTGEMINPALGAIVALGTIFVIVLAVLCYSYPVLLITRLTEKAQKHQKFDVLKEAKFHLSDLPAFAATSLLLAVLLVPLFLMLIIPGVIFGVYWIFVAQEMAFNRHYGFAALQASQRFVKDRWWLVFGYVIVLWAIGAVLSIAFEEIAQGIFSYRIADMLTGIFSMLIGAFGIIFTTVFFMELRKQKAGKGEH